MTWHPQFKIEIGNELMKATPPVAVNVAAAKDTLLQVPSGADPLQHWVFIGTLAYLTLQVGWLLWKWWVAYRTKGWTPHDD